jgi:hypothetical protein
MLDPRQFIKAFILVTVTVATILLVEAVSNRMRAADGNDRSPKPATVSGTQAVPEKRLVPSWYLARYREDVSPLFGSNQLLSSVFALGFFFYPTWGIAFTLLRYQHFIRRGGRGVFVFLNAKDWLAKEIFFGFSLLACILVFPIAILLSIFAYHFIALFTPDGYYIPMDFTVVMLFACSHFTAAWVLGANIHQDLRSGLGSVPNARVAVIPVAAGLRFRNMLLAMVKAATMAGATAFGSQVGGWIGALVGFIIASGIAGYFGFPFPTSQMTKGDEIGLHG